MGRKNKNRHSQEQASEPAFRMIKVSVGIIPTGVVDSIPVRAYRGETVEVSAADARLLIEKGLAE